MSTSHEVDGLNLRQSCDTTYDKPSRSVTRRRAAQGDPLAAMFQRLRIEDAEASVALSHARDCGCATCQRVAERAKRYKR